jgi:hypothetical protein
MPAGNSTAGQEKRFFTRHFHNLVFTARANISISTGHGFNQSETILQIFLLSGKNYLAIFVIASDSENVILFDNCSATVI